MEFVRSVINDHVSSNLYKTAKIADEYDRCRNVTIMQYEKMVRTVAGKLVRDEWSPNHKSTSNFFNIFTTQLNQFLLGNGVTWKDPETGNKLGKDFDNRLQEIGKAALCGAVCFGFFNHDHIEAFPIYSKDKPCFAPLQDEATGMYRSGVRFWRIDSSKPLRATLYEEDGYTDYIWEQREGNAREENGKILRSKQRYITSTKASAVERLAGRGEILPGENYAQFPIVPLWANSHRQSELVGMQEKIDAYDLILNGFENDLDNAQIFWIVHGAGGMDDVDLTQFIRRLQMIGAAAPMDDQEVQPVPISLPYEAREVLLDRLEKQLYRDAMIMNPEDIAGGAATATQIRAAYERQNVKTDLYEFGVIDFIHGILSVAGIDDSPTFTRSMLVNTQEEIQSIVMAADHLSQDYVTRKILTLMGDGDKADEVIAQIDKEDAERRGKVEVDENDDE